MIEYYLLVIVASVLLVASMVAGMFQLAWIGDWLILLPCGLLIPAIAAIYYLMAGNTVLAQEILNAIITVVVAVTVGAFLIGTVIYPSIGKITLSVATILVTIIVWSLR